MKIELISPFSSSPQMTRLERGCRITAIVMGVLAITFGAVMLSGAWGDIHAVFGWASIGGGLTFAVIGFVRRKTAPILQGSAPKPTVHSAGAPRPTHSSKEKEIQQIARSGMVAFYKNGTTSFLGNFYRCPVTVFKRTFQCAEAAFQWRKIYANGRDDPRFYNCTGEEAFQFSRTYRLNTQDVWNGVDKNEVMWQVLTEKFSQNPDLQRYLQATKGAFLLEHNEQARDDYWSDNNNGSGQNMLGRMLAAIRDGRPRPQGPSNPAEIQDYAARANAMRLDIF